MTDRPILFSGRMVRALLAGRKTQTRRLVTKSTTSTSSRWAHVDLSHAIPDGSVLKAPFIDNEGDAGHELLTSRIAVGDRLWVKETFFVNHIDHVRGPLPSSRPIDGALGTPCEILYRADGDFRDQLEVDNEKDAIWRPGIFTKRWASRLTLVVDRVRVERLHDITAADAIAEGIELDVDERCPCHGDAEDPGPHIESCPYSFDGFDPNPFGIDPPAEVREVPPAVAVFASLWDSINGDRAGASWHENPWVWAYTFRVERAS